MKDNDIIIYIGPDGRVYESETNHEDLARVIMDIPDNESLRREYENILKEYPYSQIDDFLVIKGYAKVMRRPSLEIYDIQVFCMKREELTPVQAERLNLVLVNRLKDLNVGLEFGERIGVHIEECSNDGKIYETVYGKNSKRGIKPGISQSDDDEDPVI